jgi:ADP-ribose pyrophosphatase
MTSRRDLVDLPGDVSVSRPKVLAKAYRDYHRYGMTVASSDHRPVTQERDVLMAGKVVLVIPVDVARQKLTMIRQFRLPAHLANGRGDLVEFVAGRVEAGETLAEAASRECKEEIGVAPAKLVELLTYLSTPGVTDEEVTIFLAAVDSAQVREGPLVSPDGEQLYVHLVSIEEAVAALDRNAMGAGHLVIGLQWLALNRSRIAELLG